MICHVLFLKRNVLPCLNNHGGKALLLNMFVCFCLFVCMFLFVCVFVCVFVCLFACFNHDLSPMCSTHAILQQFEDLSLQQGEPQSRQVLASAAKSSVLEELYVAALKNKEKSKAILQLLLLVVGRLRHILHRNIRDLVSPCFTNSIRFQEEDLYLCGSYRSSIKHVLHRLLKRSIKERLVD